MEVGKGGTSAQTHREGNEDVREVRLVVCSVRRPQITPWEGRGRGVQGESREEKDKESCTPVMKQTIVTVGVVCEGIRAKTFLAILVYGRRNGRFSKEASSLENYLLLAEESGAGPD